MRESGTDKPFTRYYYLSIYATHREHTNTCTHKCINAHFSPVNRYTKINVCFLS